jgi:hypothetical protein
VKLKYDFKVKMGKREIKKKRGENEKRSNECMRSGRENVLRMEEERNENCSKNYYGSVKFV